MSKTFILGNGPSLSTHDLSKLPEPTFGTNRSFKLHQSTHHVIADPWGFKEPPPIETKLVYVVGCRILPEQQEWIKKLGWIRMNHDNGLWSDTPARYICPRSSVHMALQIAAAMGFRTIFLLGVDLKGNHFDSDIPFKDESRDHQIDIFRRVGPMLMVRGIRLFNCSPDSDLKIFPYMPYEEALKYEG